MRVRDLNLSIRLRCAAAQTSDLVMALKAHGQRSNPPTLGLRRTILGGSAMGFALSADNRDRASMLLAHPTRLSGLRLRRAALYSAELRVQKGRRDNVALLAATVETDVGVMEKPTLFVRVGLRGGEDGERWRSDFWQPCRTNVPLLCPSFFGARCEGVRPLNL